MGSLRALSESLIVVEKTPESLLYAAMLKAEVSKQDKFSLLDMVTTSTGMLFKWHRTRLEEGRDSRVFMAASPRSARLMFWMHSRSMLASVRAVSFSISDLD